MAVFTLATAWYLLWEGTHVGPFQYSTAYYPLSDADDWRYTACSILVAQGYHLFSQVFSAQPPVLFVTLAAGMHLWGQTLASAQIVEILYGLLTLVSVSYIAWSLVGPIAGAVAPVLLVLSPGFLVYSHAVEAEGPMSALVAGSLAVLVLHGKAQRVSLLVVAGFLLSLAILTKLFAVEAFLPAAYLLYLESRQVRTTVGRAGLFALAAALPVGLEFSLVAPSQQWYQVVTMHSLAAHLVLPGTLSFWEQMIDMVRLDPGLWLITTAGLVILAAVRAWETLVALALWLGGMLLMLALFHPLFPHHLAILLPAVAVVASAAPALALTGLAGMGRYVMALLVAAYLVFTPHLVRADRHILLPGVRSPVATYAALIDRLTRPGQFVAADDVAINVQGRRDVPPPLCDPSNVRLRAGYLGPSVVEGAIRRYRARVVTTSFGIYVQVPGLLDWLRHRFAAVPGTGGTVFTRR